MRQLLSYIFGQRAQASRPRTPSQRLSLAVEELETRLLLHGGTGLAANPLLPLAYEVYSSQAASSSASFDQVTLASGLGGVVAPPPTEVYDPPQSVLDQEMGLPLLDSNPNAPATLFLDFTDSFELDWWYNTNGMQTHYYNVKTPAFDMDGNRASFSTAEQAKITEIWSRVAEDFAPFNINVTTHYYGSFNNGQALKVAIGGSASDWLGGSASGVASIGSFRDSAPNTVFVFADSIVWSATHNGKDGEGRPLQIGAAIANTISQQAGHAFGLRNNAVYDLSTGAKITDYDPGTATWTPIMGNNLASDRTTWSVGRTDQGLLSYQDDMSILAGPENGFRYRPDDHNGNLSAATLLTTPPGGVGGLPRVTGKGIIGYTVDVDAFKFATQGGPVTVRVDLAKYGPNLIPQVELRSSTKLIASTYLDTASPVTINASLAAGTYFVVVKGGLGRGEVGQYQVTVTFGQVLSQNFTTTAAPGTGGLGQPTGTALGAAFSLAPQQVQTEPVLMTLNGTNPSDVGQVTMQAEQPPVTRFIASTPPSSGKTARRPGVFPP